MKRVCVGLACCVSVLAWADGEEAACPFRATAEWQVRTAYHSRMRVSEDRPVGTMDVRVEADVGPLGRMGLLHWNYSSFCNRNDKIHRRAFSEVDYGAFWGYDVNVTETVAFSSEFIHWWITQPHNIDPYRGRADSALYELWYVGSLTNPYLVPSLLVRRRWVTDNWVYFRYGVSRSFELCDLGDAAQPRPLTVTPGIFVETGCNSLYEARFGKKGGGRRYHTGIGACFAQVMMEWRVAEHVALTARLEQFDLVSSEARANVHGNHRRDFTMFRLGLKVLF